MHDKSVCEFVVYKKANVSQLSIGLYLFLQLQVRYDKRSILEQN